MMCKKLMQKCGQVEYYQQGTILIILQSHNKKIKKKQKKPSRFQQTKNRKQAENVTKQINAKKHRLSNSPEIQPASLSPRSLELRQLEDQIFSEQVSSVFRA